MADQMKMSWDGHGSVAPTEYAAGPAVSPFPSSVQPRPLKVLKQCGVTYLNNLQKIK